MHNKKVAIFKETKCPEQLEKCLQSFLYEYRYKNKKDYYMCSLSTIKREFKKCICGIKCMKSQNGGTTFIDIEIMNLYREKNKIYNTI